MNNYKYETDFTIQLGDIGETNCLTNKAILRYMQEAGALHSDSVGQGLNNTAEDAIAWILLGWNLKVFFRPKWNQTLHMTTWSRKIEKLYCYRDYELYLDDKLVAIASAKWIAVNKHTGKIVRLSKDIAEKYNTTDVCVLGKEVSFELEIPTSFTNAYTYTSEKRDIDTNHHVNNLIYLDFAYNALPEEIYNKRFDLTNIEIMYKKEIKLGDTIQCKYTFENDKHIVVISSENDKIIHAVIYLY